MKNPEIYRPVLIAIESVIQSHFPLLSGQTVSALADHAATAVESTGVLRDPGVCAVGFCGQDAVWGSVYCTDHTRETP